MSLIKDQQRKNSGVTKPEVKPIKAAPPVNPEFSIPTNPTQEDFTPLPSLEQPVSVQPETVEFAANASPQTNTAAIREPAPYGELGSSPPELIGTPADPNTVQMPQLQKLPSVFTDTKFQGTGFNFSPEVVSSKIPTIYNTEIPISSSYNQGTSLFQSSAANFNQKADDQAAQIANLPAYNKPKPTPNVPRVDKPWHGYVTGFFSDMLFGSEEARRLSEQGQFAPIGFWQDATFGRQGAGIGGAIKYGLNTLFDLGNIGVATVAEANKASANILQAAGVPKDKAESFTRDGFLSLLPKQFRPSNILGFDFDAANRQGNLIFRALTGDDVSDINDPKAATNTNTGRVFYSPRRKVGDAWYEDPLGFALQTGVWLASPSSVDVANAASRLLMGKPQVVTKVLNQQPPTNAYPKKGEPANIGLPLGSSKPKAPPSNAFQQKPLPNPWARWGLDPDVINAPTPTPPRPQPTPRPTQQSDVSKVEVGSIKEEAATLASEIATSTTKKAGDAVATNVASEASSIVQSKFELSTEAISDNLDVVDAEFVDDPTLPNIARPTRMLAPGFDGKVTERFVEPIMEPQVVPPATKYLLPGFETNKILDSILKVGIGTPEPVLDYSEVIVRAFPDMMAALRRTSPEMFEEFNGNSWIELKEYLSQNAPYFDLSAFGAVGSALPSVFKETIEFTSEFSKVSSFNELTTAIARQIEPEGVADEFASFSDDFDSGWGNQTLDKPNDPLKLPDYVRPVLTPNKRELTPDELERLYRNDKGYVAVVDEAQMAVDNAVRSAIEQGALPPNTKMNALTLRDAFQGGEDVMSPEIEALQAFLRKGDSLGTLEDLLNKIEIERDNAFVRLASDDTYDRLIDEIIAETTPATPKAETETFPDPTPEVVTEPSPPVTSEPPKTEAPPVKPPSEKARSLSEDAVEQAVRTRPEYQRMRANIQDTIDVAVELAIKDNMFDEGTTVSLDEMIDFMKKPEALDEDTSDTIFFLRGMMEDNGQLERFDSMISALAEAKEVLSITMLRSGELTEFLSNYKVQPPAPTPITKLSTDDLAEAAAEIGSTNAIIDEVKSKLDEVFANVNDFGRKPLTQPEPMQLTVRAVSDIWDNGGYVPWRLPANFPGKKQLLSGSIDAIATFVERFPDAFEDVDNYLKRAVEAHNQMLNKAPQVNREVKRPVGISRKKPKEAFHGTAISDWTPGYNLSVSPSRGELGTGLYLSTNARVAEDYAKALVGNNAPKQTLDLDISQPGVNVIDTSKLTSPLDANVNIKDKKFFKDLADSLPEGLSDAVRASIDEGEVNSYADFLDALEAKFNSVYDNGFDEDTMVNVLESVSDTLRAKGFDSVIDNASGFLNVLDPSLLSVKGKIPVESPTAIQAVIARYNADAYAAKNYPNRLTTDANLRDSAYQLMEQLQEGLDEKLGEVQEQLQKRIAREAPDGITSPLPPKKTGEAPTVNELLEKTDAIISDLCGF